MNDIISVFEDDEQIKRLDKLEDENEQKNLGSVKNMEEWEEVQPSKNIWLPDKEGELLIGEIIDKRDGTYGSQWLIKTEIEELWTPSHKVLQSRLINVPIGSVVKIERLTDLPPKIRGQNPTTMYRVSIKKI